MTAPHSNDYAKLHTIIFNRLNALHSLDEVGMDYVAKIALDSILPEIENLRSDSYAAGLAEGMGNPLRMDDRGRPPV